MSIDLSSGDEIFLNGTAAEVIQTYSVDDIDYLQAYVKDACVKTVRIGGIDVEPRRNQFGELRSVVTEQLHPNHKAVSGK